MSQLNLGLGQFKFQAKQDKPSQVQLSRWCKQVQGIFRVMDMDLRGGGVGQMQTAPAADALVEGRGGEEGTVWMRITVTVDGRSGMF